MSLQIWFCPRATSLCSLGWYLIFCDYMKWFFHTYLRAQASVSISLCQHPNSHPKVVPALSPPLLSAMLVILTHHSLDSNSISLLYLFMFLVFFFLNLYVSFYFIFFFCWGVLLYFLLLDVIQICWGLEIFIDNAFPWNTWWPLR